MGLPEAVKDRNRRLYHTRFRQLMAVKNHLIGMGVQGVAYYGKGTDRKVLVPGLNPHVRTNLRRDFDKHGRNRVIEELRGDDPRPLVVFEVPTYSEDPEEFLVTMPIDDWIRLLRKDN